MVRIRRVIRNRRAIVRILLIGFAAILVAAAVWRWVPLGKRGPIPGEDAYTRGDWQATIVAARASLLSRPDDTDALRILARATARLGRDNPALALYGRIGPEEMKAEDYYLAGQALEHLGRNAEAGELLKAAFRVDPDHLETLLAIIRRDAITDNLVEATELARRLGRLEKNKSRAKYIEGMLLAERLEPVAAIAALEAALALDPTAAQATVSLASVRKQLSRSLLQVGRDSDARVQLDLVLAEGPDAEASWLMSRACLRLGDWENAAKALEKSASYRDKHPLEPEPAPYIGAAACVDCHRDIAKNQFLTLHASTFHRGDDLKSLSLPKQPLVEPLSPKISHTVEREDDGRIRYTTRLDGKVYSALVEYAFGSGDRGMTLVGRDDHGITRELRYSYYPSVEAGWDITSGHPPMPSPGDVLGDPMNNDGLRRCVFCHTTHPAAAIAREGAVAADQAIGCERCHGPGGNHVLAVKADWSDFAIAQPKHVQGEGIVKLCGQCHSPRAATPPRDGPTSVRFQASTLTWSKCYKESDNRLDCVTCHDPHKRVEKSAAYYESKCLDCHADAKSRPAGDSPGTFRQTGLPSDRKPVTCPVNARDGCIKCHMPAQRTVIAHALFTDHFIRVHDRTSNHADPSK